MATTLFNIVDSIKVSRMRLSRFPLPQSPSTPWTKQQETLLLKLMLEYGTDMSLIHSFFPTKTRNQIKRKHREICETKKKSLERFEQRRIRQCRKSYFDEEFLEQKVMKWFSKPNNTGALTSTNNN